MDASDEESVKALVAATVKDMGQVDILVNSQGLNKKFPAEDFDMGVFQQMLSVNVAGVMMCCKHFGKQMMEHGYGKIINVSSVRGKIATRAPGNAAYCSTKGAVDMMPRQLAAEFGPHGITVNAIAPGWIDTPMFHKATDNDPPRLAKIMGRIPAKSVGDPMDVGMCAAFLCSDAARYISGTCIPVDGGALIGF